MFNYQNMEKDEEPTLVLQASKQSEETFKRIVDYLTSKSIKFQLIEHSATRTSQESAEERNTPLEWGSKTMLVTGKAALTLLLYRANRKISWSKLRKVEDMKKSRMCNEEEVHKLGVLPGAVPPFAALLGVRGIVDSRFREVKSMAFNAGLRGKSIVMATEDFPFEQMKEADITE